MRSAFPQVVLLWPIREENELTSSTETRSDSVGGDEGIEQAVGHPEQVGKPSEGSRPEDTSDRRALLKRAGMLTAGAAGLLGTGLAGTAEARPNTPAFTNAPNTFLTGPQTVQTGADTNQGLVVKANSADQTANLLEVQDASGTALAQVGPAGGTKLSKGLTVLGGADITGPQTVQTGADDNPGVIIKANSADQTANLIEVQDVGGAVLMSVDHTGRIYSPGASAKTDEANVFTVGPQTIDIQNDPAQSGLVVKANADQSANLIEFQDSVGTPIAKVGPAGAITAPGLIVKNSPWRDVRAWGATGTGRPANPTSTDTGDRVALQAALNDLEHGDTLFFPPGVYWVPLNLNDPLTWPVDENDVPIGNVTLAGAGRNASTIMFDVSEDSRSGGLAGTPGLDIDGKDGLAGVTLSGLTFAGSSRQVLGVDSVYDVVHFRGKVTDVVVDQCRFALGRHAGLRFLGDSGFKNVAVTGCVFEHIGTNETVSPRSEYNTPRTGAALGGGGVTGMRVSGCTFTDCGWVQVDIDPQTNEPVPLNPLFHALYLGYGTRDLIVEGCYFDGSENPNTRLSNGGTPPPFGTNIFTNNVLVGQDQNHMHDADGSVFSNNLLVDTSLTIGGKGVVVAGNVFRRRSSSPPSSNSGVLQPQADVGTQDLLVSGNTFINDAATPDYSLEYFALWLGHHDGDLISTSTDWLVTGNKFIGTQVLNDLYAGSRTVFANNHINAPTHSSTAALVRLPANSKSVLRENTFITGDDGMALRDSGEGDGETALLHGNLFQSSGDGGAKIWLGGSHYYPGAAPYRLVAGELYTLHPTPTSPLPDAHPTMDGRIYIEDDESGNQNLIFYSDSRRFRLGGGTAF